MENRRNLHALILMHKVTTGDAPEYLSEKIVRHQDLHNYNTRGRKNIAVQRVNTSIRNNTFFIATAKFYNNIINLINPNNLEKMPLSSFRRNCKNYLINQQFPHLAN